MSRGAEVRLVIDAVVTERVAADVHELVVGELLEAAMAHEALLVEALSERLDDVSRQLEATLPAWVRRRIGRTMDALWAEKLVVFEVELLEVDEALGAHEAVWVVELVVHSHILRLSDEETTAGAPLLVPAALADVLAIDSVVGVEHERHLAPLAHELPCLVHTASRMDLGASIAANCLRRHLFASALDHEANK